MMKVKNPVAKTSTLALSSAKPCAARTPSASDQDRDLGVLLALADFARRYSVDGWREFARPMDVGRNASASLARLERLGLAVSRPRELTYSTAPHPPSRISREYKATDAGLAAARDYDRHINTSLTCPHTEKETDQ